VDADLGNPELARRLALLPEAGWEEVVAGQVALAEVLIESVADRLAILPWCGPRSTGGETMLTHPPRRDTLEPLRADYDLVLIDLGAIGIGTAESAAPSGDPWLDAVVLVHDVRQTPRQRLRRIQEYLETANVPQAGIAENFAA
jgi:Mrp family chromosome partitioning ATPase